MAEQTTIEASKYSVTTPLISSSQKSSFKPHFIVQKLQKYTGFTKPHNILLSSLTAVVFSAYCIFRFPALNIETWGKATAPAEWFWFREGIYRTGMKIHLCSVLHQLIGSIAAGALMPLQFLPIIRRKYTSLHRINGRILLILLMSGNISALMISDRAFGGTLATQFAVLNLAISITVTITKGYFAILNLRIDQHRTWMLRTWGYASVILTMRVLLILIPLSAKLSSRRYHSVYTCQELIFMYQGYSIPLDHIYATYPTCRNFTESVPAYVIVEADLTSGHVEQIASILQISFGTCTWLATVIHIFAVEWYLRYTSDENERLRKVSMARRKAAGLADEAGQDAR